MREMIGVANSNCAVVPAPLMFCRPLDGPLQWLGGSPLGIDEVYARLKKGEGSERGATETDKAEEWLLEQCAAGPRRATDIESAAKEEGIARSPLYRVKKRMGIVSARRDGVSYWSLPEADVDAA